MFDQCVSPVLLKVTFKVNNISKGVRPQPLCEFACLVPQEAFTRVLKGNIEISQTIFPSGTRGERLTSMHAQKKLY